MAYKELEALLTVVMIVPGRAVIWALRVAYKELEAALTAELVLALIIVGMAEAREEEAVSTLELRELIRLANDDEALMTVASLPPPPVTEMLAMAKPRDDEALSRLALSVE